MIMLEFRFHKYHEKAKLLLEHSNISFREELVMEELGNSWICFFEDALNDQAQKDALSKARYFEKLDLGERRQHLLSNLGIPL